MTRASRRRVGAMMSLTLLIASGAVAAPGGAGELSLDKAAVRSLMQAAVPGPIPLSVPGFGDMTLRLDNPERVDFVNGGLEATLPFTLEELRLSGKVSARYVPKLDRDNGIVSMVPENVSVEGLSLPIDLTSRLPPAELPRTIEGAVPTRYGEDIPVTIYAHGVRVDKERLVIEFGLAFRGSAGSGR